MSENPAVEKRYRRHAVVTGATGTIGMALIQELLKLNIAVTAMIRPDSGRRKRLEKFSSDPGFQIYECPMEQLCEADEKQIGNCDLFFYLAWSGTIGPERDDMELQLQNIRYTLDAVHLAKRLGCTAFIGAGSQAEYGRVEGKMKSDTPTFPEMGYGIAKLCAGQMSRLECAKLGMRHEWVRILSIYGPYDGETTMIISAIRKMLAGEVPEFSKGEQEWDYLYSEDAARAIAAVGLYGRDGRIYPIGSGQTRPLASYIETMRQAVGQASGENPQTAVGALPYRDRQVMYLCADIGELQQDTGFEPTVTFEEGIAETIKWCMETM